MNLILVHGSNLTIRSVFVIPSHNVSSIVEKITLECSRTATLTGTWSITVLQFSQILLFTLMHWYLKYPFFLQCVVTVYNKALLLSKKKFQCKMLAESHCINQTLRGKK